MSDLMTHSAREHSSFYAPTRTLSIGVDWDDVIMPWYDKAVQVCRDAGLCPPDVTPVSWAQHEEMGCSLEDWIEALGAATDTGALYDTVPFEGSVEGLRRLWWEGHYIHIVTARGTFPGNPRNERVQEITREQVAEYAVPHHSLTFSKDKTVVPCDFFIDDNVSNYEKLREAGVEAYLLTRPWNVDHPATARVNDMAEFVEIVLEAARD